MHAAVVLVLSFIPPAKAVHGPHGSRALCQRSRVARRCDTALEPMVLGSLMVHAHFCELACSVRSHVNSAQILTIMVVRLAGGAKHEIHWLPREQTFTITSKGEEVDEVSAHVPYAPIEEPRPCSHTNRFYPLRQAF